MASINQSNGQGALFELVARGVKDKYFIKDSKESYFPYDARYNSSTHHLAERRLEVPLTNTNFGSTFEVEINAFGDIMTECALEIDLPTWYPNLLLRQGETEYYNPNVINGLYPITTNTSPQVSYGYVNYVGYFLFEKIQFYQDQFLIQEWSGDGLLAKQLSEGSWNSSYLNQLNGGLIPSTINTQNRGIQLRATPEHLRIKLPLPGMQCPMDGGFPLAAMSWQTFKIKGKLRKLEDLVVSSDISNNLKPAPWNISQFVYTDDTNNQITFAPKSFNQIGQPTIFLSTIQHYVPPVIQEELRSKPINIPFRKQFENNFTFGELDYISLDKGGTSAVTRQLDGRHPTEKIFWFFRSQNVIDINQLDNFYNDYFDFNPTTTTQPYTTPYGEFYYNIKLVIAGRDREDLHQPLLWNKICQLTKEEKASGKQIGEMKWSTGDNYGTVYPAMRQPEGTVNFTTADRPTLYIELANIRTNLWLAQRKAELRVFTEAWNVYEVKDGRGRLMFAS